MFFRKCFVLLLLSIFSCEIWAQKDVLAPVTHTYVIKNATIMQSPDQTINRGAVIIKNGIIQAVGSNDSFPAEARIIDADSMYVYAGFIDGLSHVGVPEPAKEKREKIKDPGNPPNDVAGIEPQRDVRQMLNATDESIEDLRKLGFTVAHVVPRGRMLPGRGAIIFLTGRNADDMVYRDEVSLFSQLKGAAGIYPNTVIAVMAKYRELYRQATEAQAYHERYSQDAVGMVRPTSNSVLQAFYPVMNEKIPVAFKAESVLDIQRVLTLQRDLGFRLLIGEIKEGWDLTEKLTASGAKLFLSLDLPEMEEDDVPDSLSTVEKEKTEVTEEQEKLQARKDSMIMKYYAQPALFSSTGIKFGFSTLESKSKDIKNVLTKLVEHGLTEKAALAALTTVPAELLGLSSTLGTVEQGKIANLVISDKPYFNKASKVRYVFVDGKMFDYKEEQEDLDKGEDVDVSGTWTYTSETPQGVSTGDIVIRGEPGDFSGTISTSLTGDTADLLAIEVDGNELTFSFELVISGETVVLEALLVIDGDKFKGVVTAGSEGSYPIEGEKTPKH